MIYFTMIARIPEALILSATVDEQSSSKTREYQGQAKMLLRKLDENSAPLGSVETGVFVFHYMIEKRVCYLSLCDKTLSKRLTFAFLAEIQKEFDAEYGAVVDQQKRPYSLIGFDSKVQKKIKSYMDSRVRRNLSTLNTDLQDVQRIMVQNIDDVLQRGSALAELDNKASNLSIMSQKFKKDARYLNLSSTYAKLAASAVILFVFVLYFWVL